MYFQLHCIRQQSSRYKSARKLKKLLLLFSKKKKEDKQNQKAKQVKALATPVCKKSEQEQTNRERCEYHLVSGSRDISQL